jgi:hypothetical protein
MKLEQIPTLLGTRHTIATGNDLAAICADFETVVIGENEYTPTAAAEYLRKGEWNWRCAKENTTLHIW